MPMGGMIHFGQQLSDNGASAVVPHAEMDRSKDPAAHTLGPKRQRLPKVRLLSHSPTITNTQVTPRTYILTVLCV
jgi:hypothetical protein